MTLVLTLSKTKIELCGLVAQWITRLTTDQKIPGSNPGKFVPFLKAVNMILAWALYKPLFLLCGLVAQWITRLTTDQKIPGSNPGKFDTFPRYISECQ